MATKISEYVTTKGRHYPTIILLDDKPSRSGKKFDVTLGLRKCRMILDNIEDIRAFVQNTPNVGQDSGDTIVV